MIKRLYSTKRLLQHQNSVPFEPNSVERLNQLKEEIFCHISPTSINADGKELRTAASILSRPSQEQLIKAHWSVDEIWNWPKANGMEWVDYKKLSIKSKLESLASRGKGPIARAQNATSGNSAAKGKKKK